MDKYGYIGIETLLNYCENSKEHAVTPNEFMRMNRVRMAEPHWIPVTERLPEDIKPVIVTWCNTDPASYYQYIVGKRFIGVAHYKSGKWYWYSSTTEDFLAEYGRYDGEEFDEAIEVLAWCEMPEPYKGDDDGDK